MPSPSSESRATSPTALQTKRPSDNNDLTTAGPSPSLWPEAARPSSSFSSRTTRRVRFNVASAIPITANEPPTGASHDTPETPHTISCSYSNTDEVGSGSTLPTSNSSASSASSLPPPTRSIDITATQVFEPHYPKWHSYPPIFPTTFDTRRYVSPLKGPSFDPTDRFLEQSRAFQKWVEQKDAERIQLRHTPIYKRLVKEQHEQQAIADRGPTPRIRTEARMKLIQIEKAMKKEHDKLAPAERQCISDIEKGCVALGSIGNHEQTISGQRHLSSTPPGVPKSTLSKVERLLGSDGSCPSVSSWTHRCQSIPNKPSYEGQKFIELDGGTSKSIPPQLPQPVERPPVAGRAITQAITAWSDKPFPVLIPEWFPVAIAQRNIEMDGNTVKECYINLLNYISRLEVAKSQEEYKKNHPNEGGFIVKGDKWDKNWHDPCNGWRHEKQRKLGGWWRCNKGPDALPAEKRCRLCAPNKVSAPEIPSAQLLDGTMKYIRDAMAVVTESDKDEVMKMFPKNKLSGLEASGPLVDETLKMWAHHENPLCTAESDTIPFGTRQPWINYNPLRGIDDPVQTVTTDELYLETMAAENEEEKQPSNQVTSKGKGKEVGVS